MKKLLLFFLLPAFVSSRDTGCKLGSTKTIEDTKYACVAVFLPCVEGDLNRLADHQRAERTAREEEIEIPCPRK